MSVAPVHSADGGAGAKMEQLADERRSALRAETASAVTEQIAEREQLRQDEEMEHGHRYARRGPGGRHLRQTPTVEPTRIGERTLPPGHQLVLICGDDGTTAEDHVGQLRGKPTQAEREEAEREWEASAELLEAAVRLADASYADFLVHAGLEDKKADLAAVFVKPGEEIMELRWMDEEALKSRILDNDALSLTEDQKVKFRAAVRALKRVGSSAGLDQALESQEHADRARLATLYFRSFYEAEGKLSRELADNISQLLGDEYIHLICTDEYHTLDAYDGSLDNLGEALTAMFQCFQSKSDTSNTQDWRQVMYGELEKLHELDMSDTEALKSWPDEWPQEDEKLFNAVVDVRGEQPGLGKEQALLAARREHLKAAREQGASGLPFRADGIAFARSRKLKGKGVGPRTMFYQPFHARAVEQGLPEWGLEHAPAQDMTDANSLPFKVSSPAALSKMREEAAYLPGEKQTEAETLDEYCKVDRVKVVAASLREELHADTGSAVGGLIIGVDGLISRADAFRLDPHLDARPLGSDALFEVIKPHMLLWHYYEKHNPALANRKTIDKILVGTGCISKGGHKTPRGVDYLFDKLERKYGEHPQQLFEALYDTKSGTWASLVEGTVERDESLPSQERLIAARRKRGRSWTSAGPVSFGHRMQAGWHFVTAQGYSEDEIRRGVVSIPFLTEQLAPEDEGLHRVCLRSPDGTVERWVEGSDQGKKKRQAEQQAEQQMLADDYQARADAGAGFAQYPTNTGKANGLSTRQWSSAFEFKSLAAKNRFFAALQRSRLQRLCVRTKAQRRKQRNAQKIWRRVPTVTGSDSDWISTIVDQQRQSRVLDLSDEMLFGALSANELHGQYGFNVGHLFPRAEKVLLPRAMEMHTPGALRDSLERLVADAMPDIDELETSEAAQGEHGAGDTGTAGSAAAEAALAEAKAALREAEGELDYLANNDIGEVKGMAKAPGGVDDVFAATRVLLAKAGGATDIATDQRGMPKDLTWKATQDVMTDVAAYNARLKGLKDLIDRGEVPEVNFQNVRQYLAMEHFTFETIKKKSNAAAGCCMFVINIVRYYDLFSEYQEKETEAEQARALAGDHREQRDYACVNRLAIQLLEARQTLPGTDTALLERQLAVAEQGMIDKAEAKRLVASAIQQPSSPASKPLHEVAIEASLKDGSLKAGLTELRSMPAPPVDSKHVLEAVVILIDGVDEADWDTVQRYLVHANAFVQSLLSIEPGGVPDTALRRAKAALGKLNRDHLVSRAADMLLPWCDAVLQTASSSGSQGPASSSAQADLELAAGEAVAELEQRQEQLENQVAKLEQELGPAAQAVEDAAKRFNKGSVAELKALGSPAGEVVNAAAAIVILTAGSSKVPEDISWAACKTMMGSPKFLNLLQTFDKENVHDALVKAVEGRFLSDPEFTPEIIGSKAPAAGGFCNWAISICRYFRVYQNVASKREALKDADAKLSSAREKLSGDYASRSRLLVAAVRDLGFFQDAFPQLRFALAGVSGTELDRATGEYDATKTLDLAQWDALSRHELLQLANSFPDSRHLLLPLKMGRYVPRDSSSSGTELILAQEAAAKQQVTDLTSQLAALGPAFERLKQAEIEASKAISGITAKDIQGLKAVKSPPEIIRRVMDAVLILQQKPLNPVKVVQGKVCPVYESSYRLAMQYCIGQSNFLDMMQNFSKEKINDETVELLEPYWDFPDFTVEATAKASGCMAGLCAWCRGMSTYADTAKETRSASLIEETLSKAKIRVRTATQQVSRLSNQVEVDRILGGREDWHSVAAAFPQLCADNRGSSAVFVGLSLAEFEDLEAANMDLKWLDMTGPTARLSKAELSAHPDFASSTTRATLSALGAAFPDAEVLFVSHDVAMPEENLRELKNSLGVKALLRGMSRKTFEDLEGNYRGQQLVLEGSQYQHVSIYWLEDLIEVFPDCTQLFSYQENNTISEADLIALTDRNQHLDITTLGNEVTHAEYGALNRRYHDQLQSLEVNLASAGTDAARDAAMRNACISLDLKGSFERLTDTGLDELVQRFPGLNAVFINKEASRALTTAGLEKMRTRCNDIRFTVLGTRIDRSAYEAWVEEYRSTSSMSVGAEQFASVLSDSSDDAAADKCVLDELRHVFPDIRKVINTTGKANVQAVKQEKRIRDYYAMHASNEIAELKRSSKLGQTESKLLAAAERLYSLDDSFSDVILEGGTIEREVNLLRARKELVDAKEATKREEAVDAFSFIRRGEEALKMLSQGALDNALEVQVERLKMEFDKLHAECDGIESIKQDTKRLVPIVADSSLTNEQYEKELLNLFTGSKEHRVTVSEYYKYVDLDRQDMPEFLNFEEQSEYNRMLHEMHRSDAKEAQQKLDQKKQSLFTKRRGTESEVKGKSVAVRLRDLRLGMTPLHAAVAMREPGLLKLLVKWICTQPSESKGSILPFMPHLCDDVVFMLTQGESSLAIELVDSIKLVKSHQAMLTPGQVSFGSWQPWERSDITGDLSRFDIASHDDAISSNWIVRGSRYEAPAGFWYDQLVEPRDENAATKQAWPVEGWTLPVFCGFGIVRLISTAALEDHTQLFSTSLFKVAIESMWQRFGRSRFLDTFAHYGVDLGCTIGFTLVLAQQSDQAFLVIPIQTQLQLLVISTVHLALQHWISVPWVSTTLDSSWHSTMITMIERLGSCCARRKRKSQDYTRVETDDVEDGAGNATRTALSAVFAFAVVLLSVIPQSVACFVVYSAMTVPDIASAAVAGMLFVRVMRRAWEEVCQIQAQIRFARVTEPQADQTETETKTQTEMQESRDDELVDGTDAADDRTVNVVLGREFEKLLDSERAPESESETWSQWFTLCYDTLLEQYLDFWNIVDLASLVLQGLSILAAFNGFLEFDEMDILAAVATLFLTIRSWEHLKGFENFASLIKMLGQIINDITTFLMLLMIMLVGFGCAFYALFAHHTGSCDPLDAIATNSSGNSTVSVPPTCAFSSDIQDAYGGVVRTLLTMFRMLSGDADADLFWEHRFPSVVFVIFIFFVALGVIVMLNLLIAIMGGSFEDISENAEPETLKQKAELLLSIIAEMPDHEKDLDRFPCWLHALTSKGTGSEMEKDADGIGVHSVVQTMQKHSVSSAHELRSALEEKLEVQQANAHKEMQQLQARMDEQAAQQDEQAKKLQSQMDAQAAAHAEQLRKVTGLLEQLLEKSSNLVENLEAAQEQKERGTAALQAGETSTALQRYVDAIGLLKIAHQPPDSSNEQLRLLWQECARRGQELELACRLNAALCHIKLEQWTEAVDAAGEAVRMDGKSAKAHFRRGVARAGAGQDEAAAADLRTAAKLAPKDKAIRRELAAAKERLAGATSEPSEGTAAMSAAIASGSLYPDAPETPEAHAEVMLAKAEQMHAEGRHADALEHCKRVFRLLKPGFAPDELALQRFRAHVLSAKCHKLASTHADTPEKRSGSLTRATADLEKALSMLEGTLDISDAIGEDEVESARVELRSLQVTSTAETEQKIAELVRGAGAER